MTSLLRSNVKTSSVTARTGRISVHIVAFPADRQPAATKVNDSRGRWLTANVPIKISAPPPHNDKNQNARPPPPQTTTRTTSAMPRKMNTTPRNHARRVTELSHLTVAGYGRTAVGGIDEAPPGLRK